MKQTAEEIMMIKLYAFVLLSLGSSFATPQEDNFLEIPVFINNLSFPANIDYKDRIYFDVKDTFCDKTVHYTLLDYTQAYKGRSIDDKNPYFIHYPNEGAFLEITAVFTKPQSGQNFVSNPILIDLSTLPVFYVKKEKNTIFLNYSERAHPVNIEDEQLESDNLIENFSNAKDLDL
ncbi:MAG TPA: hypothetical protein VI959_03550 [Alphaproteobacteria bacterium]|nr:hypothetical protein [Alphaproteobacteria bacterium]